jgi:biopolymer transport protein ExbD
MGDVDDPSALGTQLSSIFKTRETTGVYREGSTTEIEKTVFVKAPRSLKYGDIVKVIDTTKGAGATPIGLQVDDLTQ